MNEPLYTFCVARERFQRDWHEKAALKRSNTLFERAILSPD